MRSLATSPLRTPRSIATARRRSVLALAAALLFTSLFIDVGVARAELPAGWVDPDLGKIGGCVLTCAALVKAKTPTALYGFGAGCAGCTWQLLVDFHEWSQTWEESECWTALGQPCDGGYYGLGRD